MKNMDGIKRIRKRGPDGRFIKKPTPVSLTISFAKKTARSAALFTLSLIIILSQSSVFSAFEAHVINVTATIENRIPPPPPPPPPPEENMKKFPPIADACVTQAECTTDENNGARRTLKIVSKKEKNARTFIRFDFHFPPGTAVQSSLLKLFMYKAPIGSREYEAMRVLEQWKERDPNGVTWRNQPDVDTEITSMTLSGVTPGWLGWNVASDTQSFIDGDFPNYGWRLGDSQEDSLTRYLAKFRSRESGKTAQRPVLEIAFTSPPATTAYPVINEVYGNVGDGKGQERKNEWVEIYNPTGSAINISGWKICAGGGCDVIPLSGAIPSHGFAVVSPEGATWGFWPGIPAGAIKIVLGSRFGLDGLNNPGDRVILRNASNVVIDAMSYGNDKSQLNPSVHNPGEGNSVARIVKGYDTNSAWDWITNITPNPGTNPSKGGAEVIRFTAEGIEVAGLEQGLKPLADNGNYEDEEQNTEESEEYAEPIPAEPPPEGAAEPARLAEAMAERASESQGEVTALSDDIEEVNSPAGEASPPVGETIPSTDETSLSADEADLPASETEGQETETQNAEELIIPSEEPTVTQEEYIEPLSESEEAVNINENENQTQEETAGLTTPSVESAAADQTLDVENGQNGDQNNNTENQNSDDGGNTDNQTESAAVKENNEAAEEALTQDDSS